MKNNKLIKILSLLAVLAVIFSLVACGSVEGELYDGGAKSSNFEENEIIGYEQYPISYLDAEEDEEEYASSETVFVESESTEAESTEAESTESESSESESDEEESTETEEKKPTSSGKDKNTNSKNEPESFLDTLSKNYMVTLIKDMAKIFAQNWKLFLIDGLTATILLSIVTVLCGTILGALFALIKTSKIKPLKWVINAIVEVIRGTPMLLQLYISTFLIPLFIPAMNDLDDKTLLCIGFTLILNSAAYVSEIIRSGIEAVDKGQTEAARSLGLNGTTTMVQIVLPQAIKNILPALGNEFITIIKETSLASTFYVGELMTTYSILVGVTHNPLPILMIIGIIYFVLNFVLSKLLGVFERRMKAYA